MDSEEVDVVVIGAGMRGLVASKTYIQVQPNVNLIVLESMSTAGGTWAEERVYPGLKTHTTLGSYEFSDLPMAADYYGVKPGGHIPGHVVHNYVEDYVDKFDLRRRIHYSTKVTIVERLKEPDQWRLTADAGLTVTCDKLIIATGLMSNPFVPSIPGMDTFGSPVMHTRDLRDHAARILASASSVTVYGGRKSAQDAVHYFASNGVKVNWCIRESGHGCGWLVGTKPVTPTIPFDRVPFIRVLSVMSPCIWGNADGQSWLRGSLHGTRLGRWITKGFWSSVTKKVLAENDYDSHPKLRKLKPRTSIFWAGSTAGGLNFSTDFFTLIKSDMVDVYVADITQLSDKTVHLSTGEAITTDALICCTGWRTTPSFKILPEGMERDLGMPYQSEEVDVLAERANKEILSSFPVLADQPPTTTGSSDVRRDELTTRPYRLYRFIAPPTDAFGRSIAWMSMIGIRAAAEPEALWCAAYLTGKLVLDKKTPEERRRCGVTFEDERMWETVLATQYCRLRAPAGYGNKFPDLTFDTMPYCDLLLRDLGLNTRRKKGFWSERFTPYSAQDYLGIVDEWVAKVGSGSIGTRTY